MTTATLPRRRSWTMPVAALVALAVILAALGIVAVVRARSDTPAAPATQVVSSVPETHAHPKAHPAPQVQPNAVPLTAGAGGAAALRHHDGGRPGDAVPFVSPAPSAPAVAQHRPPNL